MRHVLICTTLYRDHWAKTVGKKMAEAARRSDEDKARLESAKPEEHADGHIGAHCGETIGGNLYEAFRLKLKERGINDVLVSPECLYRTAYRRMHGDGLSGRHLVMPCMRWRNWIASIDEHLVKGEPVDDLIHRRLKDSQGPGIDCPLPVAPGNM